MTRPPITGATAVAGVAGSPIGHSLSPLIHNAWIEAAGIDAVYVAFAHDEILRTAPVPIARSIRSTSRRSLTRRLAEGSLGTASREPLPA